MLGGYSKLLRHRECAVDSLIVELLGECKVLVGSFDADA